MNIFEKMLRLFGFIDDNSFESSIDRQKVAANLLVLKYGSFTLAEAYSRFDKKESELIKFVAPSIKKLDTIGGIPLGFPTDFVATFPDVVLWWNNLSDEEQESILREVDQSDFLDKDNKIKQKYLMVIADQYKATGNELECLTNK